MINLKTYQKVSTPSSFSLLQLGQCELSVAQAIASLYQVSNNIKVAGSHMMERYCNIVGTSFEFEVTSSYIGNNIILMINSSSDGIFCCQLDGGTCLRCKGLLIST